MKPAESLATVLNLADEGATVERMCAATDLKPTRVYAILAKHRPDRPRQARKRTSNVPLQVRGMAAPPHNIVPRRIAELLGITPAYVYRILGTR